MYLFSWNQTKTEAALAIRTDEHTVDFDKIMLFKYKLNMFSYLLSQRRIKMIGCHANKIIFINEHNLRIFEYHKLFSRDIHNTTLLSGFI